MKSILQKNQQGIAMLIAIMVLSLGGSIALISFRSSAQELGISRYTEHEMNSQYLVESGVDQVVSWVMDPESFPGTYPDFGLVRTFFDALPTNPCLDDDPLRRLTIADTAFFADSNGPFHELETMGKITEIKFYAPVDQSDPPAAGDRRLCTLEVSAISGSRAKKKIRVDLASNPIGPITAGIQGVVASGDALPIWTHWGEIRYTALEGDGTTPDANLGPDILRVPEQIGLYGSDPYDPGDFDSNDDPDISILVEANIGPLIPDAGNSFSDRPNVIQQSAGAVLNEANPDDPDQRDLRRFLRANAELYTVTDDGRLAQSGVIKTFDEIFGILPGDVTPHFRLAWISLNNDSSTAPLEISGGQYKGYFFFSGDIGVTILGNQAGREIEAIAPDDSHIHLEDINLEGLFYTSGPMEIQNAFKAYGAFFSRGGFTGSGAQGLEVWYNNAFDDADTPPVFSGIRSVTPLAGTWATLASEDY